MVCVCEWHGDQQAVILEVQEQFTMNSLLHLHVLSCLSLAFVYQENGKWKDTDGSSLRKLLGEFEEEGITDISLHGHNIERPSGDDESGDLSFFF